MRNHFAYTAYINKHFHEQEQIYGRCAEACQEMKQKFPELSIVRGHVVTPWGKRAHWWLTDDQGIIVDPTGHQFPAIFEYLPWKPGDQVQVGTCCNCGDEIWKAVDTLDPETGPIREEICSDRCGNEYAAYLNFELNRHNHLD